jgi:PleD family two-component response regulator
VRVTLSCGVAASRPGSTFDYEQVFAAADGALYEAKRSGRNRVHGQPVSWEEER